MLLVGLTGGIATGKSTVVSMLRQQGVPVIDCDEIAHEVVRKGHWGHRRIVKAFGDQVLQADGELDRQAMGQLAFSDPQARRQLNRATHLPVFAKLAGHILLAWLRGLPLLVVDMPLLFETGSHRLLQPTMFVTCSLQTEVQRLMGRDRCSVQEAERKIAAQFPLAGKQALAHFVIDNSGSQADTWQQVQRILPVLRRKYFWRQWLTSPHAALIHAIQHVFRYTPPD